MSTHVRQNMTASWRLSLGGLSPYDASFGHFQSPLLEAIAVVFMLVVGLRFFPWLLKQVERTGSRELFTLAVVEPKPLPQTWKVL